MQFVKKKSYSLSLLQKLDKMNLYLIWPPSVGPCKPAENANYNALTGYLMNVTKHYCKKCKIVIYKHVSVTLFEGNKEFSLQPKLLSSVIIDATCFQMHKEQTVGLILE